MRQSLKVKATKHSSVLAVVLKVEFPESNLPVAAVFIQNEQIYEDIVCIAKLEG